jgi:hypothetical protein
VNYQNGSLEVHLAAVNAGSYVSNLQPDIIFLTTPHGVALTNDFAIYTNSNGSGYALVGVITKTLITLITLRSLITLIILIGDLHNDSVPSYKVPTWSHLGPKLGPI